MKRQKFPAYSMPRDTASTAKSVSTSMRPQKKDGRRQKIPTNENREVVIDIEKVNTAAPGNEA